jgi:hypothetical protein
MDFDKALDSYLRRHPWLFLLIVLVLTALASIVMFGATSDVGLVYKAF